VRIVLILFFLTVALNIFGSIRDTIIKVKSINDTININTQKRTIVFMAPTNGVNNTDSSYFYFTSKLANHLKLNKDIDLLTYIYEPNYDMPNSGIVLAGPKGKISEFNGKFGLYLIQFNSEDIAQNLRRKGFEKIFFIDTVTRNATEIKIHNVICPSNLGERLYFYKDFLSELIFPKYSEKEEIEFLKSRIYNLENELMKIQEKFEELAQAEKKENTLNEEESKKKKKVKWFKE
jgi:hypothetical protein